MLDDTSTTVLFALCSHDNDHQVNIARDIDHIMAYSLYLDPLPNVCVLFWVLTSSESLSGVLECTFPIIATFPEDVFHTRKSYIQFVLFFSISSTCSCMKSQTVSNRVDITKTRLFKYIENFTSKN